MKLNARELREVEENEARVRLINLKRQPIYFILENIYDTYNTGGLFRLADALAVEKMYLCGEMEIPPNSRIKKASIGTYKLVPWEYKKTTKEAIEELTGPAAAVLPASAPPVNTGDERYREPSRRATRSIKIIAVEQHKKAIEYTQANYSFPLALIFGNETFGILPETLKLADQIVEIPMWGINKSLNVIVSAAIVSYFAIGRLKLNDII